MKMKCDSEREREAKVVKVNLLENRCDNVTLGVVLYMMSNEDKLVNIYIYGSKYHEQSSRTIFISK